MKLFRQAYEQDNGLPIGYTELEYLETSGTQYIDTGIQEDTTCIINMQATQARDKTQVFLSNDSAGTRTKWFGASATTNYYSVGGSNGASSVSATTRKECVVTFTDMYSTTRSSVSFYFKDDPTTIYSRTDDVSGVMSLKSICVGSFVSAYPSYIKLFGLKIYNTNNVLIRDLIPVLDWDMRPAMYDKVSGKAFYNQGTGEFSYGREIHQVEYLENTGSTSSTVQYIDTGIKFVGDNHRVSIGFFKETITQATATQTGVCGFQGGSTNTEVFALYYHNLYVYGGKGDTTGRIQSDVWSAGLYNNLDITLNNDTVSYVLNDNPVVSYTARTNYVAISQTMHLFKNNNSTFQCFTGRIYYCKIWDNDVLVCDLIPAIDENGVGFMFDRVTHTIFDNAGSGNFTYGEDATKYKTRSGFVRSMKGVAILPKGFTEVGYLESTGTQYIDTGITQNSNIKAKLSVYPTVINKFIFGSRISAGSDGFGIFMHSNNGGSWYTFFLSANATIPGFVVNEKYDIEFSKDGLVVNNQLLEGPYTNVFTGTLNIYLFAMNSKGTVDTRLFIGKIYSTKLYENNVLVRDFVPCLDASNVPCMYDKVERKAYYNKGTDAFLYGGEKSAKYFLAAPKTKLEIPAMYKKLNYIESTGTQYIDTGVIRTNENTGIDITWAFSNNDANMCIFSSRSGQTANTFTLFWLKNTSNQVRFDGVGQKYFTSGVNTSASDNIFNFNYKSADGAIATLTNKTTGDFQTKVIGKLETFSTNPLYLFASRDIASVYSYIKMYKCRIYDGDTIVRNFVPVLRKSDNKPGLYDTVNQVFYVNTASGSDFNYS